MRQKPDIEDSLSQLYLAVAARMWSGERPGRNESPTFLNWFPENTLDEVYLPETGRKKKDGWNYVKLKHCHCKIDVGIYKFHIDSDARWC